MSAAKVKECRGTIEFLLRNTKREGIENFIEWLAITDYFRAPASTRLDYHGAHEGGLAQHCLNVFYAFEDKASAYGLGLGNDEVAIASLCHDLCKVNTYRPNLLKSGKLSDAKPYTVEDALPLGHGEKSVYLAARYIRLTASEALLIRWHMGMFDKEWESREARVAEVCPAIYAFQCADMEASKYMDRRRK